MSQPWRSVGRASAPDRDPCGNRRSRPADAVRRRAQKQRPGVLRLALENRREELAARARCRRRHRLLRGGERIADGLGAADGTGRRGAPPGRRERRRTAIGRREVMPENLSDRAPSTPTQDDIRMGPCPLPADTPAERDRGGTRRSGSSARPAPCARWRSPSPRSSPASRSGNILMIGSSGTGKTTLMRSVEEFLAADPVLAARSTVVRIHANVLGEEAEAGRPGDALFRRLLGRAREQLGAGAQRAGDPDARRPGAGLRRRGRQDPRPRRRQPNVAGIRAQEALLTLIENEAVPVDPAGLAGRRRDDRRLVRAAVRLRRSLRGPLRRGLRPGDDRRGQGLRCSR